jgi:hypothetical protein
MSFFSLAFPLPFFVAANYLKNNISFIFVKKEGATEQCQAINCRISRERACAKYLRTLREEQLESLGRLQLSRYEFV